KLALLSIVTACVFSACSSEPKKYVILRRSKNATELESKIKECDKNANSAQTDTECANAYKANYSKSFQKPRESAMEFFKNNK
ncbi:EexN family lipoprotein, partial [Campylobacter coli]